MPDLIYGRLQKVALPYTLRACEEDDPRTLFSPEDLTELLLVCMTVAIIEHVLLVC